MLLALCKYNFYTSLKTCLLNSVTFHSYLLSWSYWRGRGWSTSIILWGWSTIWVPLSVVWVSWWWRGEWPSVVGFWVRPVSVMWWWRRQVPLPVVRIIGISVGVPVWGLRSSGLSTGSTIDTDRIKRFHLCKVDSAYIVFGI